MEEQDKNLEAMEGVFGDEAQFQSLLGRTQELVDQSFDMLRMISGSKATSVLQGNQPLVSYDP